MNLEQARRHDRPICFKDKNPRKRNRVNNSIKDTIVSKKSKILLTKINNEISINYVMTRKRWNRSNVVVDNIFAYNVALDIIFKNEDPEPKFI